MSCVVIYYICVHLPYSIKLNRYSEAWHFMNAAVMLLMFAEIPAPRLPLHNQFPLDCRLHSRQRLGALALCTNSIWCVVDPQDIFLEHNCYWNPVTWRETPANSMWTEAAWCITPIFTLWRMQRKEMFFHSQLSQFLHFFYKDEDIYLHLIWEKKILVMTFGAI